MLDDLGPDDQWKLNPDDPSNIQKLLDEAKQALPRDDVSTKRKPEHGSDSQMPQKPGKNFLTRDLDMSAFSIDDPAQDQSADRGGNANLENESQEVQDIVAKLLDEVNIEKEKGDTSGNGKDISSEKGSEDENEGEAELNLPSAPLDILAPPASAPSRKSLDFESDMSTRMAALRGLGSVDKLGLPSVPTFKPSSKPVKTTSKGYTDEEIDSWCIICQDDATIKCMGCDGDLYCANCWKEGHMGPDVGWEEKRHKWGTFRKPN